MNRYFILWIAIACCLSCSPYAALRKKEFTYTDNTGPQAVRVKVPKRYAKREMLTDSAGNQQQVYRYGNGALLYLVYTKDTLAQFQPIDTAVHVSLPHPQGGVMYKGLDTTGRFWREVRTDSFRFGYRFVPHGSEILFDSAVNYAGTLRYQK